MQNRITVLSGSRHLLYPAQKAHMTRKTATRMHKRRHSIRLGVPSEGSPAARLRPSPFALSVSLRVFEANPGYRHDAERTRMKPREPEAEAQ